MVQIRINGQDVEVTVRANDTYRLQLWSNYANQQYTIKNITPFPDDIITQVTTDSDGYAETVLIFHNDTPAEKTIEIWAHEYLNILPGFSSNTVLVHILPSGNLPPTCIPEGEFNFPYLGKDCCPGLETGYDFKCHPIITPLPVTDCYENGEYNPFVDWKSCCPGLVAPWYGGICSPIAQPQPVPTDRYYNCISGQCKEVASTTGYKNDLTCQGKCIVSPAPAPAPAPTTKKYKCINGTCREDPTGTYLTSTCGGTCAPASDDTTTAIALVIAAGIAAALILKREK